jgi:glycosyltransferase involved in cell wall biosynthesis
MKVTVLTTSYPRDPGDSAGRFVADAVRTVERHGVTVNVVSPASFPHFGVAFGGGIVQNLRREPWRLLLLPGFMAMYARAARRAAAGADVVHAHWLPSALAARATAKPYVVQLWGTDVELARRAPALARPLLRGAAAVVAASESLAAAGRALGARTVEVIPSGVEVPAEAGEPEQPPHVLFVGRLSEEKGILEFLAATEGIPRVIVGDGPLRARVPETVGFVPPAELGQWYDRASVVCVPSRREGYGMTAREAMAHGSAVVASDTGGLREAIRDGETGLLVPPRDPQALRAAVQRLLADDNLRLRLGAAARVTAQERFSLDTEATALIELWQRVAVMSDTRA